MHGLSLLLSELLFGGPHAILILKNLEMLKQVLFHTLTLFRVKIRLGINWWFYFS